MFQKIALLALVLLFAAPLMAAQPVPLSPAQISCGTRIGDTDFEPAEGEKLDGIARRDLESLFRQLEDDWLGEMRTIVCMASGKPRVQQASSELLVRRVSGGVELRTLDTRLDVRGKKRHKRRLFLVNGTLRVDNHSRLGEVQPIEVGDSAVSFLRRYRSIPQRVTGQWLATGKLWTPQASTAPAAGGGDSAAPGTAVPDPSGSVIKEERFYLRLSGSNELTVTQQFFSQGVYTGSTTWQFRRQ